MIETEVVDGVGVVLGILMAMFLYFFYGTQKGKQIRDSKFKAEKENSIKIIDRWRNQIAIWQAKLHFILGENKPEVKIKPKTIGNKVKKHYFTTKK